MESDTLEYCRLVATSHRSLLTAAASSYISVRFTASSASVPPIAPSEQPVVFYTSNNQLLASSVHIGLLAQYKPTLFSVCCTLN